MQIDRAKLYEMVSASPLREVAKGLGVTPAVMAEICRAHSIPYPGSGHWTKILLGKPVSLTPLPELSADTLEICIEPRTPRVTSKKAEAQRKPKEGGQRHAVDAGPKEVIPNRKPHAIVAKWLEEHRRRTKEAASSRDPWVARTAPSPLTDVDYRRHKIVDALLWSLEQKGATVSETNKGLLRVTIERQSIEFQVREKCRQQRVPKEDKRSSYLSQELVGTGKLVFGIRTYLRGPHNEEWRETEGRPLESQLSKFVDRLFEGARILREWEIEHELERERWRKEAANRAEKARLVKQESLRRNSLAEQARDWQSAKEIREFLAVLKQTAFETDKLVHGRTLGDWIDWAENAANALDKSRAGIDGVFAAIGSLKAE